MKEDRYVGGSIFSLDSSRRKTFTSGPRGCFFGRERGDVQCMDVGLHHVAQSVKDEPMPLQGLQAREAGRHDAHTKMALAFARASVADMQMALVDKLNLRVSPVGEQAFADACRTAGSVVRVRHASVELEESAGTLEAIQIPCPRMNSTVRPITPNSLKFTQTFSSKL